MSEVVENEIAMLQQIVRSRTARRILREEALRALAAYGEEAALPDILSAIKGGEGSSMKVAALQALKELREKHPYSAEAGT